MAPPTDSVIRVGISGQNDVDAGFRRMSQSAKSNMADIVRTFDKSAGAAVVLGDAIGAMAGRFVAVGTAFEVARRSFMAFADVDLTFRRIGLQADATTKEIEGMLPQFTKLAQLGGNAIRDVANGFNTFRERSHLSLAEAKLLFPEIVKGAHASGVSITTMAESMGSIIFNLKITGEEAKRATEVLYTGLQKGNLNLQEMSGMIPELTATMKDWGETGVRAEADMTGRLSVLRDAFGSSGEAATGLFRIYQSMSDPRIAQALGRTPEGLILELRMMQRQGKNAFEEYIKWIDLAVERGDLRIETLDRRQRLALDTARKGLQRMKDASDQAFDSQGRLNRAIAELKEGPMDSVNKLIVALESLAIQIGATFHKTGVTDFLEMLNKILGVVNDLLSGLIFMRELMTSPFLSGKLVEPQQWQDYMKGLAQKYLPETWSKKIEEMEQKALKERGGVKLPKNFKGLFSPQSATEDDAAIPRGARPIAFHPADVSERALDEQRETNLKLNEILETLRGQRGGIDGGAGGTTTARGTTGQSLQQYTGSSGAAPLSRGRTGAGGGGGARGGGGPEGGGGGAYPPNEGTLAQQRQRYMAELEADPQLKQLAIGAMASEGGVQSNLEQLFNYANMRGMTIRQALYSGQYGPVTGRNRLSTEELLRRGARQGQKGEAALQKVGAGSNITNYATDQGMAGDPNYAKYMANRDYYNMHKVEGAWFSYHGERGRKWAQRQKQIAAESGGSGVFDKGAQAVPYAAESDAFGQSIMPQTPQDSESTHTIKYRFERDPGEVQFRRGTMRQQMSVEARNSLYESASDIGMA